MSLASREALNNLISNADVAQFATHAEDWSTCSSTAVLAAAADELGRLADQRAYVDNVGQPNPRDLARASCRSAKMPCAGPSAAASGGEDYGG